MVDLPAGRQSALEPTRCCWHQGTNSYLIIENSQVAELVDLPAGRQSALEPTRYCWHQGTNSYLIIENAQVAELVDALVSNTNGRKAVPVRPRPWVLFPL